MFSRVWKPDETLALVFEIVREIKLSQRKQTPQLFQKRQPHSRQQSNNTLPLERTQESSI